MRNKYIRFFISSTFADMDKERNLLQQLFSRISEEYAQKDWQIEYVDLRWGISQEAGFDNKTIRICETEIKRCQQMSPHPNFIVLLGNRYGWTPLPETITYKNYSSLKMTNEEKRVFNDWYRFDKNALPDGEFVLQGRYGEYRKAEVWSERVEYVLGKMFIRNTETSKGELGKDIIKKDTNTSYLYGDSATAQEINMGVFKSPGSEKHVIVYLRNLSGIPIKETTTFYQEGKKKQRIDELKDRLRGTINKINILEMDKSFDYYSTGDFDREFMSEMEKRIRFVINNAIDEYESTAPNTEDDIHLQIALDEAKDFVGREKELSDIQQYIIDPNEHRPLWIKADSGSGKTALLAKVIAEHQQTHQIICRFCGRSANTLTTKDISFATKPSELKKIFKKATNPTLIVLDALNQLDDKDDLEFASLDWLNVELPAKVKFIVSTTNELKYTQEPRFIKILKLPNMGQDSEMLVYNILKKNGRKLSYLQSISLQIIINNSNRSAIYLHILGNYLKLKPSWETINETPSDLQGLVVKFLETLTSPENYGQTLVREAISLLTVERIGLSDKEMLEILSGNESIKNNVESNSFHQILLTNGKWEIPSILWIRLRYELSPFLRTYLSQVGQVTTVFHEELKRIFESVYLYSPALRAKISSHLFHYYKKHVKYNEKHALLEVIQCSIIPEATEKEYPLIQEVSNYICSDLDFLLTKHQLFPHLLIADFDRLIPFLNRDQRERLFSLKLSISSLPLKDNNDLVIQYIYSLPSHNILHQLADSRVDKSFMMKNEISDSELEDSTLYALTEIGLYPCMSDDGTKVASLFDNCYRIKVSNLVNTQESFLIELSQRAVEIQCDDNMNYITIRSLGQCAVLDNVQRKEVFWHELGEHGWISLSGDAKSLACGDSVNLYIYKLNDEGVYIKWGSLHSDTMQAKDGRLSPSGNTLWILRTNQTIWKYNLVSGERTSIQVQFYNYSDGKEIIGNLYDENAFIPSCTDNRVICYHDQFIVIWDSTTNERYGRRHGWILGDKPIAAISRDDDYLLTFIGPFQIPYCHIDKINESGFKSIGHSFIPGLRRVNSDFTIALDVDNLKIIKLLVQLDRYNYPYGYLGGANSLSCSYCGDEVTVGFGKNISMERKRDILRISYNKREMWYPPFNNDNYLYVNHTNISPNQIILAAVSANRKSQVGGGELVLYDLKHNKSIAYIYSDKEEWQGLEISTDSKYIVADSMDIFHKKHTLFLLNNVGDMLNKYDIPEDMKLTTGDYVGLNISENNRYVISSRCKPDLEADRGTAEGYYSIFDLCNLKFITTEGKDIFPMENHTINYMLYNQLLAILPIPSNTIISNNTKENCFLWYNLSTNTVVKKKNRMNLSVMTASRSGRFLFLFNKNHQLFMQHLFKDSDEQDIEFLLDNIQWVLPALDENHIYAITDEFHILLYNIKKKKVEQQAYRGNITHAKVCAKGLYVANNIGDVALFVSNPIIGVNKPAVTTFVRRWNLETKVHDTPTAICPICGHEITLSQDLSHVLKEGLDTTIVYSDWDNKQLIGHKCPKCNAQLKINPYII